MKILVIDDDVQLRGLIRKFMQQERWEVHEAADGHSGIRLATVHRPDLVLCDYEMDGMNGFEVLAELRATDLTATIPFVLMTAVPLLADSRRTMDLGADDHLAKPFSATQLLQCIGARMERVKRDRRLAEEKLVTLRSSIAAALPHGMKTPLNGILGYAELLRSDFDAFSREEIREMLNTIYESAESLNQVVDRFVEYTELLLLSSQPAPVRKGSASLDLASGAEVSLAAHRIAARYRRDSDLIIQADGETPVIPVRHLTRLTEEIVDNAFKFSPAGTVVVVESVSGAQQFTLTITDRGPGMTADHVANIGAFMQFERKRREQQGLGLGLVLARLIAETNAGSFAVESTVGHGTRIIVTLPRA